MERDRLVEQLRRYLSGRRDLIAAYLFGSYGRGEAGSSSDADVGLILAAGRPTHASTYTDVISLQGDLEQLSGLRVDLVVMNGAGPDLLHRILRDGILLHESDHAARMEFELRARNDYFDLQPMLQYYRRTVIGSA